MEYLFALAILAVLLCLMFARVKWKQRQQDVTLPLGTTAEMFDLVKGKQGQRDATLLQAAFDQGRHNSNKMAAYSEETYSPLGTTTWPEPAHGTVQN
jgi:hypothetical protein